MKTIWFEHEGGFDKVETLEEIPSYAMGWYIENHDTGLIEDASGSCAPCKGRTIREVYEGWENE